MTRPPAPERPGSEQPLQQAFAAALLDPTRPAPAGLRAWNGSDPSVRFAVYRNNVMHSLVAVLGDTFPVVRQLVGDEFFCAAARLFVTAHPPSSPLMHRYGLGFANWLRHFAPAAELPYLADMARLEWARLAAFHAAEAAAVDAQAMQAVLQWPEELAATSLVLHPSLAVVQSPHPIVSLWHAHQQAPTERDERLARLQLDTGEAALVFRVADDALLLQLPAADAALAAALATGTPLGAAQTLHPQASLVELLVHLLQHGQLVGINTGLDSSPTG